MTLKLSTLNIVGQTHCDFELTKIVEIPELQCVLRELIHLPTSAQVMHVANDDPENLFCLSFQTIPTSSNGVAHVLEHTVLCGSKKFPISDPFFAMNRRSLNTFMNALTGSDFTCYPAASQVHKDFYNLLEVYIDAVFHPNLKELSFLQEGHRLEFADIKDPRSPLERRGIVYNEMKGALSSASSRLAEALNENLFPNLTYGHNSGGDPKEIPQLTHQELIEFHQTFYHPSRCLFFFYGNIPLEEHLNFIAKHALKDVVAAPPLPPLPRQPRFSKPVYRQLSYPISPSESPKDKTLIAFGWLTSHILEQQDVLALSILDIILMDTDASPLKMAFLKSEWCKQVSSYLEDDISEIPWSITLKGCNPENADNLENLLKETLTEIIKNGIPLEMIENAIHQLEFHHSEITGDQTPFGLSLFMRSALLKQHGANPELGLTIHSLFEEIRRKNLEDPHYLTQLLQKHLLDNPHFVRIVMTPDQNLGSKEVSDERIGLDLIQANLTEKQTFQIIKKSEELASYQKKQFEEDVDILPKVTLNDVPPTARDFPLKRETLGSLEVFSHHCFTNDIVYADLVFNLPDLPETDLPYVRLFTSLLSQVGCGNRSYKENLDYIQGNTGGVGAVLSLNLQATDHQKFQPSLHIKGKALNRKASKLFPLMHDMITTPDFKDITRLKEMMLKIYTTLHGALNQNALKYATNLSASPLNAASKIANSWYGLDYFYLIKELAQNFESHAQQLSDKLEELKQQVMCLENPHLVLSCDQSLYQHLKSVDFYGLQALEKRTSVPWKGDYSLKSIAPQGRIIASPVAFISHVLPTVSYIHPAAPALNIAAFLFDNLVLHTKIREQGGAYGGGSASNSMSGNFYFYSYRDPNIASTLQAFQDAIQTIASGDFDLDDLEEAKLEMIQALDSPISPGSRADLSYSWWREGKTHKMRQEFRSKLLELSQDDIIDAVEKQIKPNFEKGTTVAFAGKELLEKENEILKSGNHPLLTIKSIENPE